MKQRFPHALFVFAVTFLFSATAASSQSTADWATVEKARSAYLTHPVPGEIACGVELDWDKFFEEMKVPLDDAGKTRLAKLKATKIAVVSKGLGQTEVKVDAPEGTGPMSDGLRQQLNGFFEMYWSQSYGKMLPAKPDEVFDLAKTPGGYKMKTVSGVAKVELDMDKAYVVTSESFGTPQMSATMTPVFKPEEDGLLRLRALDETVDMGATKMIIHLDLDYQRVGAFEVPNHVNMSLPGSYAFNYTFVGCKVQEKSKDAPASKN